MNILKIIGGIVLIVILFAMQGCSRQIVKDINEQKQLTQKILKNQDMIIITYKGKEMGKMTVEQWKVMISASDFYLQLKDSEDAKRMTIALKDNPWELPLTANIFKTKASIIWLDEKGKPIKTMTLQLTLTKKDSSVLVNKIDQIYTKISRVGFPVMTTSTIIMIILLIILL